MIRSGVCLLLFVPVLARAAETSTLTVESEPTGATVLVFGLPLGKTPLTLRDLPPEGCDIEISLPGFSSEIRHVALEANKRARLWVKLQALSSGITVSEEPGSAEGETAASTGRAAAPHPRLVRLIAEFDSLVRKGLYARAQEWATRAARMEADPALGRALREAAGVARALGRRREVVRHSAEKLLGLEAELKTKHGTRKGSIEQVTESGISLVKRLIVRGRVVGETRFDVAWSDLTPEQEAEFAEGWRPRGATGAIADAFLALEQRDAERAILALGDLTGDPLARYYRWKAKKRGNADADAAARVAWDSIERKIGASAFSAAQAREVLKLMAQFEKEHSETRFALSLGQEPAKARARAQEVVDSLVAAALRRGLVLHWTFNEGGGDTARDHSGGGNHGRVIGATWTSGKVGGALSFDGINDCVTADIADWTARAYTVALWSRAAHAFQRDRAALFNNYDARPAHSTLQLDVDPNTGSYRLYFQVHNHISFGQVTTEWRHLAATFDGSSVRVYLDGRLASMLDRRAQRAGATFGYYVVGRNRLGDRHFEGLVDDVRVYNHALSASEIQALHDLAR